MEKKQGGATPREPAADEEAIAALAKALTPAEKIHLLHGDMHSGGVERLGVPGLACSDGPMGIRLAKAFPNGAPGDGEVQTEGLVETSIAPTAFCCTLGLAAAFDVDAATAYGAAVGREARAAGIQVMFGPGVNLMRDPRCGRNFEYMGEDPHLAGAVAAAYIRGMQGEGVGACAKHFYANDAERFRHYMDSRLDKRTAWELHLAPFVAACREGGVWTIMTGNNLVNGRHISENPDELKAVLRDVLGWDGVILTDWRAAYGPAESIAGGVTMTTGFCGYVFGDGRLLEAARSGAIDEAEIDSRARDVLRLYKRTGLLDGPKAPPKPFDAAAHRRTARRLAREGVVLLKNDGDILPLAPTAKRLLLAGPAADRIEAGTGSGQVDLDGASTPRAALAEAFAEAEVVCEGDLARAVAAAPGMDAVIYFAAGPVCGEGYDLETIRLDDTQQREIAALAEAAARLVVVVQCGTAMDLSRWIDKPAAVLVAFYGGRMIGEALADLLSGAESPSGKLPCTFGRSIDDYPCARLGLWPAKLLLDEAPPKPGFSPAERSVLRAYEADYREGVFIGYRWFQSRKIEPLFPFGFGLSYTRFEMADLEVDATGEAIELTCAVTNVGDRAGAEVVQAYVAPPAGAAARPVRELKAFAKTRLEPGETAAVGLRLPANALALYDEASGRWKAPAGRYRVEVGASCEDIRLAATVELGEDRYYDL